MLKSLALALTLPFTPAAVPSASPPAPLAAVASQVSPQTPRQLAQAFFDGYIAQGYSVWNACGELQDLMNNEIADAVPFYCCPGPHITEDMADDNWDYIYDLAEAVEDLIRSKNTFAPDISALYEALEEDC